MRTLLKRCSFLSSSVTKPQSFRILAVPLYNKSIWSLPTEKNEKEQEYNISNNCNKVRFVSFKDYRLMSYVMTPTILSGSLLATSFLPQLAPTCFIMEFNIILILCFMSMDVIMYGYQQYSNISNSFVMHPAFFATIPQYIRYLFVSMGKKQPFKSLS